MTLSGWNMYYVMKWFLDLVASQVSFEVTGWYNIGHLVRDLRLDFLDMYDIDSDARIPITKIGIGSQWDDDYDAMLDNTISLPTDVDASFFGVDFPINIFLLIFFPFMIFIPLALRVLPVPLSSNMPGREAESTPTGISGLTEGYSWEDIFGTIVALVIIVLVGGGLAIFVPKMAGTFMNKVFGGIGKNYLKDIYEDLGVGDSTTVNTKLVNLKTNVDSVGTTSDAIKVVVDDLTEVVDGINTDLDVGEESLTDQITAIKDSIDLISGNIINPGKEHNLRSQVVYMRNYTEAILQYLMDPMGTARPNANQASFWIET